MTAAMDTIKINGIKYELDPDPEIEPYADLGQSYFQAATDADFWQTWEMRSFQGGERRTRILVKEQLDEMTYDDGEGIDISTWGEAKLQPELSRTGGLEVSSAHLPMVTSNNGQTVIVGHGARSGYYITTYSGGVWTGRTTPNAAAVTDLIVGKAQDIYGIQGSKIIQSTNNGTSWSNNTSAGVPTDMVALAFCANQLYALGPTYLKYWDGAEWQTAADFGGQYACAYGEQVYFARDNIIHRYNGTAAYEADRLPQGFIITGLYSYRNILFIPGYFYVQGGRKGAVYFILDGRDAHLYNVGSYDGSSDYTVSAIAGSDDEVYFANQKRGGVDRYDLTVGGLSCGPAWGAKSVIPYKSAAYSNGKVLVGRNDGVPGTDGVYVANVAIPTAYRTSGWLTTPEYDWFFPHDYKIFSKIAIWHKPLAVGEKIQVEYSLDGGDNWVLAGVSETAGEEFKEFKITNARSRTCKLRLTLQGPGTSTPVLTYVRVDAGPLGEEREMWDINLQLWSKFQGRQKLLALKAAYKSRSVVEFVDLVGDKYAVIFEYLKIKHQLGDKWSAQVFMRLREV